ncbi:PREDICTED: probable RNA methyltransferase At5g51130 isoform X2 [Nelumbo nucifera]|uniref:RNA methyltransferase n=1 Tax=Nelumbo nucifera TaxID=4432 RepID=A0A1U8Q2X0_NELNU|nr:PREDICTED: probable RNA methyltransferase At5g51130 isoform X2 [Nelumbo nucifera]
MANDEKTEVEDLKPKKNANKRKRKEFAIYGNYRNYYGYRIGQNLQEDPRLSVLRKEWFEDKECLDIGCNQGLITISIAKKFCCRRILGIDIDGGLIESACWNLRRTVQMEKSSIQFSNSRQSEHSEGSNGIENGVSASLNGGTMNHPNSSLSSEEKSLSDIISFRKENIIKRCHGHSEEYDTILCLSVTKWIHLNWGDEGLITLFSEIWRLLRPEALFNYHRVLFRPSRFQEILLDKIGFRTVEDVTVSLPGCTTGFDRPILAFCK